MDTERKGLDFSVAWRCWLPLGVYMAFIYYVSSLSLAEAKLPEIWNIDKLVHVVEYGILGILWSRALTSSFPISAHLKGIAIFFTILYGISDEIHQMFVPNRNSSIFDVMADGIGAWAGVWLYFPHRLKSRDF